MARVDDSALAVCPHTTGGLAQTSRSIFGLCTRILPKPAYGQVGTLYTLAQSPAKAQLNSGANHHRSPGASRRWTPMCGRRRASAWASCRSRPSAPRSSPGASRPLRASLKMYHWVRLTTLQQGRCGQGCQRKSELVGFQMAMGPWSGDPGPLDVARRFCGGA